MPVSAPGYASAPAPVLVQEPESVSVFAPIPATTSTVPTAPIPDTAPFPAPLPAPLPASISAPVPSTASAPVPTTAPAHTPVSASLPYADLTPIPAPPREQGRQAPVDVIDACEQFKIPIPIGSSGPQGKNRTFASLYQDWYYTRAILSILGFDVEQKFNGPYRERALIWRDGRVQTLEDILTKLHWTCSDFDQKSVWYLWAENAARKKMWNPHKIPPENPGKISTVGSAYSTWKRIRYFFTETSYCYRGDIDPDSSIDAEKDLLNLKQINIKTYMSYIEAHLVDIK
ncbi:hypothetical protein FB446DRAFT_795918 [Lentinula raphanica]|nr:hypothetical protein FB446DRAFT_795918 [Lentinula raphanica]